jgi:hypothetical protein
VLLALDAHKHQWVCGEDLLVFLKNFGFEVNIGQVDKLVEVINCSQDGRITQEQLRWTVEGFENKNKGYLEKIKDSNRKGVPKTPKGIEKGEGKEEEAGHTHSALRERYD